MDKINHGSFTGSTNFGANDDMRVLNMLVARIDGLMPVSGSAEELGLPDPESFDGFSVELA